MMKDGPAPEDFGAKMFTDREHSGTWRVEEMDEDGAAEIAMFSGPYARERAIRYADREYVAFDEIELKPYQRLHDQLADLRELRAALRLIRETVEELVPPGSLPNAEHLGPEPMREAEAIIRGIHAIAGEPSSAR